ncbi:MAG: four helix bundle protein [Ekhidna sp.]
MRNFKDLEVWVEAHEIALSVYKITSSFPKEEIYGITSQLRRSALSIPNNIAEGCGRGSQAELKRFCDIAMGSASEVEYLLLFCRDLGLLEESNYAKINEKLIVLKKRLNAFIQHLKPK